MTNRAETKFAFVSAGRRIRELCEDYPGEVATVYGSKAASNLRFAEFYEKARMEFESDRGVTFTIVAGEEWREFLSRKPGWRELSDPDDFIRGNPVLEAATEL